MFWVKRQKSKGGRGVQHPPPPPVLWRINITVHNMGTSAFLLSVGLRASTHNGFWAWKVFLLLLLCVTTFVIPVPHLDSFHTGTQSLSLPYSPKKWGGSKIPDPPPTQPDFWIRPCSLSFFLSFSLILKNLENWSGSVRSTRIRLLWKCKLKVVCKKLFFFLITFSFLNIFAGSNFLCQSITNLQGS